MIGKKEHSAGGSPHTSHHIPSLMFHTICLCRNNWGVTDTMCTDNTGPAFVRHIWREVIGPLDMVSNVTPTRVRACPLRRAKLHKQAPE